MFGSQQAAIEAERLAVAELNAAGGTRTAPKAEGHVRRQGNGWSIYVRPTNYLAIIRSRGTGEFGPKGKAFGPKKKQALRFIGTDGSVQFATSSRGTPGTGFIQRAQERVEGRALQALVSGAERAAERLRGRHG